MKYIKTIGNIKSKYAHNEIYADKENYYIKSPKKDVYLIIDKDDNTLNFIEECINKYGCLHSSNATHGFEMCKEHNGKRERVYISQLLFAFYHNREFNNSQRLIYKDGNNLNCKKSNLFLSKDKLKLESLSVSISYDDSYIYIKEKHTGLVFVTDYEPELLLLIANPRISYSLNNSKDQKGGKDYNRLTASLFFNNKRSKSVYTSLPQLIYGYYYYGVRRSNLITAMKTMQSDLRKKDLVIEHLIGDELNNTKANLSTMSAVTNSKKRVIDRKIQPPYYLIMSYKYGVYKAVFCADFGTVFVSPVITCATPESLLKEVKKAVSSSLFGEYKSALEWHSESDTKRYNLQNNYKVQKVLYDNFESPLADIRVAEYIASLNTNKSVAE